MGTKLNYNKNIEIKSIPQLVDELEGALGVNNTDTTKPIDFSVTYIPTNLIVNFDFDLTQNQIDTCDNTVNNFIYNPNYTFRRFFKINNSLGDPSKLDYDILGLNKKRVIIKGELREVGYYCGYNPTANTFSDLVVLEKRTYNRDPIGIATSRNQTSIWYLNDGNSGLTKTFTKYYTEEQGIEEGINRRGNMLSFAKTSLLNGLKEIYGEPTNQSYAFDMLTSVKTEMEYFTQGYTQPLRDAVSASTKPYLTEQIKINVIEQLTF